MHEFARMLRGPQHGSAGTRAGTGVTVDIGFQCDILEAGARTLISYRHDLRAWLNAEQGPRRHDARDDAFMALEDLWI